MYYKILSIVFLSMLFSEEGYFREIEASFCMAECSQYALETEDGDFLYYLIDIEQNDLSYFINRYVSIDTNGTYECLMCSAEILESIQISNNCDMPVSCFADPCEIATDCQINTPVECTSDYCGGCYADFYDLEGNLVDCYIDDDSINECYDIGEVFFGICQMYMGVAVVNGECVGVSGCGWIVDGIDYSNAFFETIEECESYCFNEPYICEDIEYDYDQFHSDIYTECENDGDCISVWGDCGVGLGGCHYAVNSELYQQESVSNLVDLWIENDCMEWVCDCFDLPSSHCIDNTCQLAYCDTPNPSGCFNSGCSDNYECMNYEFSNECIPSSCYCEEYFGYWSCTEDCNGGSCYQLGDVNGDGNINVVDAVSVINMILNITDSNVLADVNSDNIVNVIDVVMLINTILD